MLPLFLKLQILQIFCVNVYIICIYIKFFYITSLKDLVYCCTGIPYPNASESKDSFARLLCYTTLVKKELKPSKLFLVVWLSSEGYTQKSHYKHGNRELSTEAFVLHFVTLCGTVGTVRLYYGRRWRQSPSLGNS